MAFINSILQIFILPFKALAALLAPLKGFRPPPWLRWVLELALVIAVVVGLTLLNRTMGLEKHLTPPRGMEPLRPYWLGLIGFLVYLTIRLLIYVIQLIPGPSNDFPDIDEAFEAGLAALDNARISFRDSPIFLVIGMTADQEPAFLQSNQIGKDIDVRGRDLPIHWFGNDKAIWLTLPGISALAWQSQLSERGGGSEQHADEPGAAPQAPPERFATMGDAPAGSSGGSPYQTIGAPRFATLGGGDAPARRPAAAESPADALPDEGYRSPTRRLTLDEKDLAAQRMAYFVKKLQETRNPVCTANGILLVLPFEWTTSPGLSQLADTAKVDMSTLQQDLGVKCVCLTVFTGIHKSPGFTEYVNRLQRSEVERRCGCSFPTLIHPDPGDIEKSHGWLMQYFERQIFDLFQRKLGDQGNGTLFRFLDNLRKSRSNYVRLLHHAFPEDVAEPFYLGGIYYAGIGKVGNVNLPFLDGVLAKLQTDSDEVIGWNDASLHQDRQQRRMASVVMTVVVLLTAVNALLVVAMVLRW